MSEEVPESPSSRADDPAPVLGHDTTAPVTKDAGDTEPAVRVVDRRWWAREEGDSKGGSSTDKPSYVAELERQLAEKETRLQQYAARFKAAADDFDQTRQRLRREVAKDVERERRQVLAAFLDIVDDLDRAIDAARDSAPDSALLKGVELVRQRLLAVLDGFGVTPIEAVGTTFDPTRHDAIATVPVTDDAQHDIVVAAVKRGYMVGEDVLRAATVTVGRNSGDGAGAASGA